MYCPAASTVCCVRLLDVAFRIDASITWMCAAWQSRSATSPGSVWYQTTETLPASPAVTHGQKTRAFAGAAIVIGADHVRPKLDDDAIITLLGAALGPPLQPPVVP